MESSNTIRIIIKSRPVKNISPWGLKRSLKTRKKPTTGKRIPIIKRL
jgi:hypothetical protein